MLQSRVKYTREREHTVCFCITAQHDLVKSLIIAHKRLPSVHVAHVRNCLSRLTDRSKAILLWCFFFLLLFYVLVFIFLCVCCWRLMYVFIFLFKFR